MMTDIFTMKPVQMAADDWHAAAEEALACAVVWLQQENGLLDRGNSLVKAAELLRARDALHARGGLLDVCEEGSNVDHAEIEVWEEGSPAPAWPVMSARLREMVGEDKRLLKMVDQIDGLHALAVEKGLPVVTMDQLEGLGGGSEASASPNTDTANDQ